MNGWLRTGSLAGLIVASVFVACEGSSGVSATPGPPAKIALVGDGASSIEARVLLDDRLQRGDIGSADVIWVVGATDGGTWQRALGRARGGAGLVVAAGADPPDLSVLGLRVAGSRDQRASLRTTAGASGPLASEVVWTTAPQAGKRLLLSPQSSSRLVARVETADGNPVLLDGGVGDGRVVVLSLDLSHRSNNELVLWPYFNYLLHVINAQVTAARPAAFGDWEHSPVPGARAVWVLAPLLGLAWLLTLGLFIKARRYSRRHPEIPGKFFAGTKEPPQEGSGAARKRWATIGFVRPLAGFLTLAALLFLLFAPYYWLTNIYLPNDIQPFPQAKGIWEFAWESLQLAWFLFDVGTLIAFIKYFAEFRPKDPKEAVRSAQFYVWWQILTGLVQVTFACVAAVVILPHTRYGYTSNFIILATLYQYPGFFGVLTFFFQAYQRYDYNLGLDLLSDWILRFLLQIPFVLLFRAWGVANPEFGEALGAAVGIGVGYIISTAVTFAVGTFLYRRLGLKLLPLFLAHFDVRTAKRMLWYGLRVVFGKFLFRAAQFVDKIVISLLLINYTEWLGLKSQINYNLLFLFPVAYRFFETAMAALSEAHGNEKRVLTQYYVVRFFQVGSLYTGIGLSLMVALGPMFVEHAMDPQWGRAGDYLIIAAACGAFFSAGWLSDMLQKGSGRPGLFAITLGIEQALRIGLFMVLIPKLQFFGFYLAILLTIMIKVVGAWTVNHLVILRLRLYVWQMFIAPAIAGLANFVLLRLLAETLGLAGRWPVVVFFFCAALLSFLVCFFVCGVVGGFDRNTARELEEASRMGGLLRPLTRLFYYCARTGWGLSPLHGRFPVTIHEEAIAEAHALQRQRDQLDQAVDSQGSDRSSP